MAEPTLDETALDALEAAIGRESTAEVLVEFGPDAQRQLEGLVAAVAAGNTDGARRAAHNLKSTSATVGGRALAQRCGAVEADAEAGMLDDVGEAVPQLRSLLATLLDALQERGRLLGP